MDKKIARREKNSGSVGLRDNGKYRLRAYLGTDPVTGKPRYKSKDVEAPNITAARKLLATFVSDQQTEVMGSSATVRTLMKEWLAQITSDGKAPRTIETARRSIDQLINPELGDIPVDRLTGRDIDEMNRKTAHRAAATRRRHHAVLSAALNQAVKWGWIDVNPAVRSNAPRLVEVPISWPSKADVAALISAMPGEMWKTAVRLAVLTGARRGELCALRWTDVDVDRIHIRRSVYRHGGETHERSTKGGKEREIVLVPEVAVFIAAWKQWCEDRAATVGLAVKPDGFLISTWPDCSHPINPDNLTHHVGRAADKLGLDIHLHGIRHLAATEMLAQGVGVRDVAEALGHADGGRLVLRVYGHPTADRQRAAALAMAGALTMPELEEATNAP